MEPRTRRVMASTGSDRATCSTMEAFIDRVKHHPCVWKISEICYRDTVKKDLAWEHIARECGMANSREAKNQWKKLRDSHREALRRRKTASGEPVTNLRPWKYEALMEFVVSQNETTSTNAQDNQNDKSSTDSPNNVVDVPPAPSETSKIEYLTLSNIENELKNRSQNFTPNHSSTFQTTKREQMKKERVSVRNSNFDANRGQDALSNLFTSLCQKTRELPKYLQLRVQREIFDSVSRAEEEALTIDTMSNATPTYSLPSYEYSIIKTDITSPLPDASPSPGASTDDT